MPKIDDIVQTIFQKSYPSFFLFLMMAQKSMPNHSEKARLVRHGKMSSRQALHRLRFQDDFSLGRRLPNLFDVADAKTQIAILETAEGIGDDWVKADALGSLSERLPEPRRTEVLDRALADSTSSHAGPKQPEVRSAY